MRIARIHILAFSLYRRVYATTDHKIAVEATKAETAASHLLMPAAIQFADESAQFTENMFTHDVVTKFAYHTFHLVGMGVCYVVQDCYGNKHHTPQQMN